MTGELEGGDKWRWIYRTGLHGQCPRCGEDNEAQFAVCFNCGSPDGRPAEPD